MITGNNFFLGMRLRQPPLMAKITKNTSRQNGEIKDIVPSLRPKSLRKVEKVPKVPQATAAAMAMKKPCALRSFIYASNVLPNSCFAKQ